ncbi:MAG: hypothetical protein GY814_00085 [Gammaproteobacteria bacterium]|nr:hypothetical protein [Gammaproteobacteria bacterium]
MATQKRRIATPQISTANPGGILNRLFVVLALLVAWTWAAYQFGRDGFELGIIDPPEQVVNSGRQLEQLRSEYKALKRRADAIGKSGQEMSNAQKMAMDEISRLQDERTRLIRDISAITESAEEHKLRLDVKDVEVRPGIEAGVFYYTVTIEPQQGVDWAANGTLKLAAVGAVDGEPAVVNMSGDDGVQENNRRIFGLHQDLRGTLQFPDGFTPEAITMEVATGDDTANPLMQKYDWSDVLLSQQVQQDGADNTYGIIDNLKKSNLALIIKTAKYERAEQQRLAAANSGEASKLEQERKFMAQEIAQLKQKVDDLSSKLKIRGISLKPKAKDGVEFEVTITRTIIDGQRLEGVMTVSLIGVENKEEKIYLLEDLTTDQKLNYKLGFKNYQTIKESLQLPKGFVPQKIMIHVESENIEIEPLNEMFDWLELTEKATNNKK